MDEYKHIYKTAIMVCSMCKSKNIGESYNEYETTFRCLDCGHKKEYFILASEIEHIIEV